MRSIKLNCAPFGIKKKPSANVFVDEHKKRTNVLKIHFYGCSRLYILQARGRDDAHSKRSEN